MEKKFKVGDKVRRLNGNNWNLNEGETGIVEDISHSQCRVKHDKDGHMGYHDYKNLVVVKKGKAKPDTMIRYMVYGLGCNNKGNMVNTEKELRKQLKINVNDLNWTGRIIGYKLTPILEGEAKVEISKFKKK